MADQKAKVIPGIPLAALDAIQDSNVRDVLRAIVDTHHVRNGNSGDGNKRFVTAEEVGLVGGRTSILGGGGGQSVTPTQKPNTITPSQIGRIINDLQAQIIESPLFKDLGDRITLIDGPNGLVAEFKILKDGVTELTITTNDSVTQINGIKKTVYDENTGLAKAQALIGQINTVTATSNSAAARALFAVSAVVYDPITGLERTSGKITEERIARANNDNALARAVNTIWATVGDNSALIQEGAEAVTNNAGAVASRWAQTQVAIKDPVTGLYINSATVREESKAAFNKAGALEAKYTVKIDLNGYVTGFGLAATSNNGQAFSEFYIRADRFAIGSPQINRSPNEEGIYPPADPAQIPFIVITGDSTLRNSKGEKFKPGAYMKSAFISELTADQIDTRGMTIRDIDGNIIFSSGIALTNNKWETIVNRDGKLTAQRISTVISDLAVGTLQIGNNAVTVPTYTEAPSQFASLGAGSMTLFGWVYVTYSAPVSIATMASWVSACGTVSTNTRIEIRVVGRSETVVQTDSCLANYTQSHSSVGRIQLPAGTHRIEMWFGNDWYQGSYILNKWSCLLLGVMK